MVFQKSREFGLRKIWQNEKQASFQASYTNCIENAPVIDVRFSKS